MQRLALPLIFTLAIVTVAIIWGGLSQDQSSDKQRELGESILSPYKTKILLPTATVSDAKGKIFTVNELTDDATLLTVWSSKCNQCREGLLEIQRAISSRSGVKNLLVNLGDEPKEAASALKNYGVEIDTYFDRDGSFYSAFEATMPSSYYIRQGAIIYYFPGRISKELLEALLKENGSY